MFDKVLQLQKGMFFGKFCFALQQISVCLALFLFDGGQIGSVPMSLQVHEELAGHIASWLSSWELAHVCSMP